MKSRFWQEFIPKSFLCFFKEKYTLATLKKDLLSGTTVGIVALPLSMAFAIASGVTPERGLFTAIIAGFLISLLGGSRVQIGGPTGAFVVIVYDIVQREGYAGLVLSTLIAGILLLIMGLARIGTWIKYIPYPLITGFTSGIAVIIFSSQVKEFLGLKLAHIPADFIPKWQAIFQALPSWDPWTLGVSGGSLGVILLIRRFFPAIPWGIATIVLGTLACTLFSIPVTTLVDRYGEIPRIPPSPSLPVNCMDWKMWHHLMPDAITIALLAAIEALLCAVIADGMTGRKHKSNCELVAQGFANLGSVFFGGIPATGAIARTVTNVKTGARTPLAGMVHALVLFLIILALAPLVSLVPLPCLSAVLIMIAWNMCELDRFRHLLRAPLGDVAVMLTAFFLTVLVDITVAVEVGMILAAFLFMKRMSDMSAIVPATTLLKETDKDTDALDKKHIPPDVEIYEINGPLFFGIADTLQTVLDTIEKHPKVFILRMRHVPVVDASGLNALDQFYEKCQRHHITLLLSGVKDHLAKSFTKFGVNKKIGKENILPTIDAALKRASALLK